MTGLIIVCVVLALLVGWWLLTDGVDMVASIVKLAVLILMSPVIIYKFVKNGGHRGNNPSATVVATNYFLTDSQSETLQRRVVDAFQRGDQRGPAIFELERIEHGLVVIRVRWAPGARARRDDGSVYFLPPEPWLFGELSLRHGVVRVVEAAAERISVMGTIGHFFIAYNAIPEGELDAFVRPVVETFPEMVMAPMQQNDTRLTFVPMNDGRVVAAFQDGANPPN